MRNLQVLGQAVLSIVEGVSLVQRHISARVSFRRFNLITGYLRIYLHTHTHTHTHTAVRTPSVPRHLKERE